jgi:hypothetical protein
MVLDSGKENADLEQPGKNSHGVGGLLVLLGLASFAITEPLLTIFGANPSLFLFHNVEGPLPIVAYALVVALAPAFFSWLVIHSVSRYSPAIGDIIYGLVIVLLVGVWLIQLGKWNLDLQNSWILLAGAGLGATVFLFLFRRLMSLQIWVKISAIAALLYPLNFVLLSESGQLTGPVSAKEEKQLVHAKSKSVLFLILDELPTLALLNDRQEIDSLRYPNFGLLADEATWYRHFTVQAAGTTNSVPSLLTGREPQSGAATNIQHPDNLFTLLEPSHHLVAYESVTGLCGLAACTEGAPGSAIERSRPDIGTLLRKTASLWLQRISLASTRGVEMDEFQETMVLASPQDQTGDLNDLDLEETLTKYGVQVAVQKPQRLEKFIQTFTPTERASLYFLHLELPHLPWRFYESGTLYDMPVDRTSMVAVYEDGGRWLLSLSEYRFVQQAKYTDILLGEIVERLKLLEMWNEMLVVVISDHGRSFKPGMDGRAYNDQSLDSIAYVPLFIKLPGQLKGNIDDRNVMAPDILPTIAEALGITVPWEVDGFPVSHPQVTQRGEEKHFFPMTVPQLWQAKVGERYTFKDSEHFPSASSRSIGPSVGEDDSFAQLIKGLNVQEYLGRSVDEFAVMPGGKARIDQLAELRKPRDDRPPMGVVVGHLEFLPKGDRVLIAVNGVIVTASPLVRFRDTDNFFIAMLPPGVMGRENVIEALLIGDSALEKISLR